MSNLSKWYCAGIVGLAMVATAAAWWWRHRSHPPQVVDAAADVVLVSPNDVGPEPIPPPMEPTGEPDAKTAARRTIEVDEIIVTQPESDDTEPVSETSWQVPAGRRLESASATAAPHPDPESRRMPYADEVVHRSGRARTVEPLLPAHHETP
ncbi:MAG: hypothetical protein NZO58_03760 [Gemmataceae bacterium]|nr:hypothetical protein [Gemmataceae bacterium]